MKHRKSYLIFFFLVDGEDFKLTINQIAAQAFVFFLAGFETASTTLCSFMYEMTQHQDVQDKLRNEIHQTLKKYDGKLTYEGISEMNYLDKVIDGNDVSPFYGSDFNIDLF